MRYSCVVGVMMLALGGVPVSYPQSLVEVARKEAERRRNLKEVQARQIDGADPSRIAPEGSISTSSPVPGPAAAKAAPVRQESRESLRSYQSRLQKLDRDIAQTEQKLKVLRLRVDAERWAPAKTTKGSVSTGSTSAVDQMRWQITELEAKLADLRDERSDVFQAGKRAGYLPGELEGRVR
jgi:septal ring factor EnvC (AmiA/AmiB activator)